jgi:hypothetical protein
MPGQSAVQELGIGRLLHWREASWRGAVEVNGSGTSATPGPSPMNTVAPTAFRVPAKGHGWLPCPSAGHGSVLARTAEIRAGMRSLTAPILVGGPAARPHGPLPYITCQQLARSRPG